MEDLNDTVTPPHPVAPNRKKSSLHILPETAPLRGDASLFLKEMQWSPEIAPDSEENNQPRALRALSRIIDGGLCHRCGSCVGICPTGVLSTDENAFPTVTSLSSCTDCNLCVRVCPGDEFNFHEFQEKSFGQSGDIKNTHGFFLEGALAYGTDPYIREHSTSGGMVTALLLHMMEKGEIDGAVCITSDKDVLWRGKPTIARTKDELLATMKSKYAISPTNEVFSEIREIPGRYALVGLPCQIHGFKKAAELDAKLNERVVMTIGLFCHAAVEHEGYKLLWDSIGDKADGAVKFTSRIGKHPGTPYVTYADGSKYPFYFGDKTGYRPTSIEMINILYRLYSPARCLTCFDASAEFADISVGDPWMAPPDKEVDMYEGWSFTLVRSQRGKELCERAEKDGAIRYKPVTRNEALACNSMMANEKRYRAFRIIETHKRQGKSIPAYGPFGFEMPKQSGIQFIKTEINMLTHAPCFMPRLRKPLLKFILSDCGYYLLWLNNFRRRFRWYVRDIKAAVKNKIFGRR